MKKYNFTGNEAIFDYKRLSFAPPYKLVYGSVYLVLMAIMLGISHVGAQVTVGGEKAPAAGSVLSLNSDTEGGLQLSNVNLGDLTEIPTDDNDPSFFPGITSENQNTQLKGEFKGAMIYNINPDTGQGKGIHTWNRGNWDYFGDNTRYFVVPDYANGKVVIDDTGTGTWIATKPGFVICTWISPEGPAGNTGVKINNDRVIGSGYTETSSGQKAMIPIAAGQVLTVTSDDTFDAVNATFYPPLFVQKNASNGSYSFDEVKTNDIWLDGKPIYKQTVYYNSSISVNNGTTILKSDVFTNPTEIDKVLKLEGYCSAPVSESDGGGNAHFGFIGLWTNYNYTLVLNSYYDKFSNSIKLERVGGTITLTDLTITLYYTKNN
jgi:hypothetical protein